MTKKLTKPTTCQLCTKWLRPGLRVFKWWPVGEEKGLYPNIWACNLCFRDLCQNKIRPEPFGDAEVEAALVALSERDVEPVPADIPHDVVPPPARRSPMNDRR